MPSDQRSGNTIAPPPTTFPVSSRRRISTKLSGVHPAVRIAGDDDLAGGRGDAGIADEREILRVLADNLAAGVTGDLGGVVACSG